MSIRRLAALAAVALFGAAAAAQPADRVGVYGVLGSAAPERSLFPDAADPVLVLGVRLAPGLDAHVGASVRTDAVRVVLNRGAPVRPSDRIAERETTEKTRALAAGLRAWTEAGPLRLSLSTSVAVDGLERTVATTQPPVQPTDEERVDVDRRSAVFAHAGLSAVAAAPLAAGRIAPGLGVAASFSGADGDALAAPPLRWMPFVSLPATVRAGAADVTLDARVGMAKGAGSRSAAEARWAPVVEAGLRVDL